LPKKKRVDEEAAGRQRSSALTKKQRYFWSYGSDPLKPWDTQKGPAKHPSDMPQRDASDGSGLGVMGTTKWSY